MTTTKRTGYPVIDDILESIAPPSTEQPRPEQGSGGATGDGQAGQGEAREKAREFVA